MTSLPTVNWWRGGLREHESYLSLIARFSSLNGLHPTKTEKYLNNLPNLQAFAESLGDDVDIIRTVLNDCVTPHLDFHLRFPNKACRHEVRYCPECAKVGYHSQIHEYRWLALCPFHMVPLKEESYYGHFGSHVIGRCQALRTLMQAACPAWPMLASISFDPNQFAGFCWLKEWLLQVQATAELHNGKVLWHTDDDLFPIVDRIGSALGRLHGLNPIPDDKKIMFTTFEEGWTTEIYNFSKEIQTELGKMENFRPLFFVLLFKRIAAYSRRPFEFNAVTSRYRAKLVERHNVCRCQWGCERLSNGGIHWLYTQSDGWPYWNLKCPYVSALERLDAATGYWQETLTFNKLIDVYGALRPYVRELEAMGLIGPHAQAPVVPEERLCRFPEYWTDLDWIGTPCLNKVLDTAACMEASMTYEVLVGWLDAIEAGNHPAYFNQPPTRVELQQTQESLKLIRWHRDWNTLARRQPCKN